PVLGVRELLLNRGGESAALANNPLVFPDDETRRRLFTWGSFDADVEAEVEVRFADISG
ncbi:MAG: spermidine/putrescine ABC transporter substrate-binding protein, partial [Acidimicrobiales bacterium]|nr:spermidine/putrescine ABC transporter substrate-binding protein [Acidimicrobiales bacterium]